MLRTRYLLVLIQQLFLTGRVCGLTSSSRLSCYHYNILALRCISKDFRSDPLYLWAPSKGGRDNPSSCRFNFPMRFSKPLSSAAPHSARRFSTGSPGERMCRVLCSLVNNLPPRIPLPSLQGGVSGGQGVSFPLLIAS